MGVRSFHDDVQRFSLQLSLAVPAAQLRAWIDSAPAGERAIYASGVDLPRDAEGVKLAGRWARQGLVRTFQQRDPEDERRWLFLIEKARGASPQTGSPAPAPSRSPLNGGTVPPRVVDRALLRRLLDLLRRCAERGEECPSNAELAQRLNLRRGERGRQQAKYLMQRLSSEKRIAVESRGTCAPRVVTILAPGRARGKRTGEGGE